MDVKLDVKAAVRQAHDDLQREIDRLESTLRGIQEKLDQLRQEKHGLALWLARNSNGAKPEAGWLHLGRANAVHRLLMEAADPMGPSAISKALIAKGRKNDSAHYVGAALHYLKKTGRARPLGDGRWVADQRPPQSARLDDTKGGGS